MICSNDGTKLRHIATGTDKVKYYQCPQCKQKCRQDGCKTYGPAGGRPR